MNKNPLKQAIEKTQAKKFENIKQEFEKEKAEKTHRTVRLVYKSCCGCGCHDEDIKRIVPDDSPLQNGDRITKLEKGDDTWD